jgi:very-short-patch-repair endonuclease
MSHSCKYCGKSFDHYRKLGGHISWCPNNPKTEQRKKNFNINYKPRKHTLETKKKISKIRRKYLQKNPDKVPYKLYHASKKSWIEEVFMKYLKKYDIGGWVYNYHFGIYSLDFAFPEWKLDVELDGNTHNLKNVIEIDKRRDQYLIENGWKVLRITGKEIKENVYQCIQKVCDELKNDKIIEIPKEFLHAKRENELKKIQHIQNKTATKNKIINLLVENGIKSPIFKEKAILNEREYQRLKMIFKFIYENRMKWGSINKLANYVGVSHSTIRRMVKKYNIHYDKIYINK